MHSLVQVPSLDSGAPRIYDRSFIDFIVGPASCPDRNLAMDIGSTEKHIFNKCSSLHNLWQQKVVNSIGANHPRENDHATSH